MCPETSAQENIDRCVAAQVILDKCTTLLDVSPEPYPGDQESSNHARNIVLILRDDFLPQAKKLLEALETQLRRD